MKRNNTFTKQSTKNTTKPRATAQSDSATPADAHLGEQTEMQSHKTKQTNAQSNRRTIAIGGDAPRLLRRGCAPPQPHEQNAFIFQSQ